MFLFKKNNSLKKYKNLIPAIHGFASSYRSSNTLQTVDASLKRRYRSGEELTSLLPEAFGLCNEALRRVYGIEFYDCQYIGGMVLHDGRIAELKTGEGKTYVSFLAGYLNSLTEKNIHIVTANEYLAQRDKELLENCYNLLGITVGLSLQNMQVNEKKENYGHHITYSTATEIGFDYLRDNLVYDIRHRVLNGLNYAIIDEVDSILLDDARVPLIISAPDYDVDKEIFELCNQFILSLNDCDYEFLTKRDVQLTDEGIGKIEAYFDIAVDDPDYYRLLHYVNNALKANKALARDRDYIISKDKLELIDFGTGRIAKGRKYCSGLHQAIECKENISITDITKTVGTITYQNLFHEYAKLCGMTGTAKTDEAEFKDIYNMDVVEVETHRPVIRSDLDMKMTRTREEKYKAVIREIVSDHPRPVLVGCTAIKDAEAISRLLVNQGVKHKLLTAKNLAEEARIIALSGKEGSVTVSTNIAGRGTDIKLDAGMDEIGGLKVIGVGIGENIRIDNQLKGRSGRQGDNGSSIFYVSLDEEMANPFEDEKIEKQLLGLDLNSKRGIKNANSVVTSAQKTYADLCFQARKNLAELDDFVHMMRLLFYGERDEILENNNVETSIRYMGKTFTVLYSRLFLCKDFKRQKEKIQIEKIRDYFDKMLFHGKLKQENFTTSSIEQYQEYIFSKVSNHFLLKATQYMNRINVINREVFLYSIDEIIIEMLDEVEFMRITYFLSPQKDKNDWLKAVELLKERMETSLMIRILQRIFDLP